jgi:hypothetical protein
MDRRSFITTLIGGLTAASFGGVTLAAAEQAKPIAPGAVDDGVKLDAEALDKTDADFVWHRRWHRRRRWRRRYYYYRPRYYRRRHYRRRWRRW